MKIPAIAVHGGSGTIPSSILDEQTKQTYLSAMEEALDESFELLKDGGTALETVIKAVCILEDCELFNAGKGSVFTAKGTHEMDASIMDGKNLKAGAVAGIQGIKNPILLAADVMQKTDFVFIAGKEAMEYAREQNYELLPDSYFFTEFRYNQWQNVKGTDKVKLDHSPDEDPELGTVGAVAVDREGNVAAATSTGGMTNKAWGRIGDSPIIGAGTYANNKTCAVSCTGHGEYFIRGVAAYDVSCLMEFADLDLELAAKKVINHRLKKMGGEGGLIAVDARGNICMPFNTEGMYRGMKNARRTITQIL